MERLVSNVSEMGHAMTVEHACFILAFENALMLVEQSMMEPCLLFIFAKSGYA